VIQSNELPNIIIEKKDNSFIISDYKNNRKITWSPQNNSKKRTNINDIHATTKQNVDNVILSILHKFLFIVPYLIYGSAMLPFLIIILSPFIR
jgi:hypothetical protein